MDHGIIKIVIPIPKESQNKRRGTAMAGSFARKKDRERAKRSAQSALSALQYNYGTPWPNARIHVRWFHKTRNFRDKWNIVGCLKGTLDGIVDAGILIDDDQVQPPTVECLVDKDDPRVELYLEREDSL